MKKIDLPDYAKTGRPKKTKMSSHTTESLNRLRKSCRLARKILLRLGDSVRPGISTEDLDNLAFSLHMENDCYPSPLNYYGFPKSITTSVNHVACHGIPNKKEILKEGDIINIDVTTYAFGMHGDTSITFPVGEISEENKDLIRKSKEAMFEGISKLKAHSCISSVGKGIEDFCPDKFSIIKEFIGHGIGDVFHGDPNVFPYFNKMYNHCLRPNTTLTVEPILSLGSTRTVRFDDGWTYATCDKSNTAQFEHTVLVTEKGPEILTLDP